MSTRREFIRQTAASVVAAASVQGAQAAKDAAVRARKSAPGSAVRLVIVGVGDISPRYFKQAAQSKRAHFVATCARHLDSAKARAVEYGIGAWYDDYAAMYEKVKPDAVVIATPNSLHAAPAIAALERGIHVLCEKPMATTWEDCQAMVASAKKSGATFLALPYNGSPADSVTLLAHVNEGTLGVFTGAEAQVLIPGPGRDNWYYDRKVAGGAMLDTMVYPVSSLINILGPVQRVTGMANTLIPHRLIGGSTVDLAPPRAGDNSRIVESNVDDNISLLVEWSTGQQAMLRTLWGSSFLKFDSAIYGRQGTVWMSGDETIVHSPNKVLANAEPLTWRDIADCYRLPANKVQDPPNEDLLEHFVDCIQGLSQPTCGGVQQLHVHEILFKGYEAARTGTSQLLETTFTPWHSIEPSFDDTRSRAI